MILYQKYLSDILQNTKEIYPRTIWREKKNNNQIKNNRKCKHLRKSDTIYTSMKRFEMTTSPNRTLEGQYTKCLGRIEGQK